MLTILVPDRLISSIDAKSGISSSILSILLFSRFKTFSLERSLKPPKTDMLLFDTSRYSNYGTLVNAANDFNLFS